MTELEAKRELERRGQAIADAMGRYRGTEPLIEAVGRMRGQLERAELERAAMLPVLRRLLPPDRLDLWDLEMFRDEEELTRQVKEMWVTLGLAQPSPDAGGK